MRRSRNVICETCFRFVRLPYSFRCLTCYHALDVCHCSEMASPPKNETKSVLARAAQFPAASPQTFSIVSLNVLADQYATSATYKHVRKEHLDWAYRLPKIRCADPLFDCDRLLCREQLMQWNPDIICLQEIHLDTCVLQFSRHDMR